MVSAGIPRLFLSWLIKVSNPSSRAEFNVAQVGLTVAGGVIVAVGVFVGMLVGEGVWVMGRVKPPLVGAEVGISRVGVAKIGM